MGKIQVQMTGVMLTIKQYDAEGSLKKESVLDLREYSYNRRITLDFELSKKEDEKIYLYEHLSDEMIQFLEDQKAEKRMVTHEEQVEKDAEAIEEKKIDEEYVQFFGEDVEEKTDRVIAVYAHHQQLYLKYGKRKNILHSLVRMNMVVRGIWLNKSRLAIDTVTYVENYYSFKIEDAVFTVGQGRSSEHYHLPVLKKTLGRFEKYQPKYYRRFVIPAEAYMENTKIGGNTISVWLKIDGIYVKYRPTIKFNQQRGRIHERKEYYVPMKSTYAGDYAVQIRRDYNGHLMLIKRLKDTVEDRMFFRIMESGPVSMAMFYLGKLVGKVSSKKTALFYEKFAAKAEEGTFELFEMCRDHTAAKCYYIIDSASLDYEKIKNKKHVVPKFSLKYYWLLFTVDAFVSTEAPIHLSLMDDNNKYIRWNLCKHPFVFLQHGVTYLKPQGTRSTFSVGKAGEPAYIVVNSDKEGEAVSRMMQTPMERNLKTGMMIFDYCEHEHIKQETEDVVVIMMTWRPFENDVEDFAESVYYQYTMDAYHAVSQYINPEKIIIVPHPKVRDGLAASVGEDLLWTKPISEVLAHAKLLITDYSSVCYNSFYQGGGVVFYQPDLKKYEAYMKMPLVPQPDEYIGYRTFEPQELEAVLAPGLKQGQIQLDYFRTPEFEKRYQAINEFSDGKCTERIFKFLKENVL